MDSTMKENIRIAIVGVGNCASSLVQGICYYRDKDPESAIGLMHWEIGNYRPFDVEVTAAFDIDSRKVGKDISEAIFAEPNSTKIFCPSIPKSGVIVEMGKILDGLSPHMGDYPENRTFLRADAIESKKSDVIDILQQKKVDVLVNYLPVGSEAATQFYAECALDAGVAFLNNIPVFIASDPKWEKKFSEAGIPIIGDDIKAQLGATIAHRALTDLFKKRGVKMERTYQLNTGGNTDFLNMLNRSRLMSKKTSKTEAVQSVTAERLGDENIHVGPSDYVPWQNDNKVCFIRMEGKMFGDVEMNLEMRLSVEDSPNSAGVAIDAIRCLKLAQKLGIGGNLEGPAAFFCKHPPKQFPDDEAYRMTETFIENIGSASLPAQELDSNGPKSGEIPERS